MPFYVGTKTVWISDGYLLDTSAGQRIQFANLQSVVPEKAKEGGPDENGHFEEAFPSGAKSDPRGSQLARPGVPVGRGDAPVRRESCGAGRGTSYGAPTAGEIELANLIRKAFPSIEKVRLVSSGTEAAMSAVRLARGVTGRDKIVKFEGCYHGHADPMLVKAGSGALTFGQPDSPGVPEDTAKHTLTATFNDASSVRRLFDRNRGEIAAVIVEPIPGNMGVVLPAPGFLDELREITRTAGALLIFDEVITGFRVAFGGAQELFGIEPDLTVLGKIIGGGLPVGAFGGKRDVMAALSPEGPVYQAGTLSGNPLAVAAGVAALTEISKKDTYRKLDGKADYLGERLQGVFQKAGVPTWTNRVGSMWTTFFQEGPVVDYGTAKKSDTAAYGRYFHAMLARGIYLAPSQFEAGFVSLAHSRKDLDRTIRAAREALSVRSARR
jgi:glutamate-1-semialdehyde 2,1-aminomutase